MFLSYEATNMAYDHQHAMNGLGKVQINGKDYLLKTVTYILFAEESKMTLLFSSFQKMSVDAIAELISCDS